MPVKEHKQWHGKTSTIIRTSWIAAHFIKENSKTKSQSARVWEIEVAGQVDDRRSQLQQRSEERRVGKEC